MDIIDNHDGTHQTRTRLNCVVSCRDRCFHACCSDEEQETRDTKPQKEPIEFQKAEDIVSSSLHHNDRLPDVRIILYFTSQPTIEKETLTTPNIPLFKTLFLLLHVTATPAP